MTDAVLVSAVRTPAGKAPQGQFRYMRPDDLAALVLKDALARVPGLDPATVDDVVMGCAMPEAEQGMNVARIASLRAGVPHTASAVTVNRFCASGLEAIACAVDRIRAGSADVVLAGGTESMSLVPMGGHKISPNPGLVASYPDVYLTTGLVAENHAREHRITRDAQDAYAYESHRRAIAAHEAGRFTDEIVPVTTTRIVSSGANALASRAGDRDGRRGSAPRHLGRGAREVATGLPREGHRDRRQLVADERRCRSRRRDERVPRQGVGPDAAGAARRVRHRRCRARAVRHRAGARRPQGAERARDSRWPTSTSSS